MSIFFLGAGFSRPAGLPLGNELFPEMLDLAKDLGHYDRSLKHDIELFIEYYQAVKRKRLNEDDVNFEEFMSYLDIEHFLGLRGSNETSNQRIFRNLLALVLHSRECEMTDADFSLYEKFAERLKPSDLIFTFNYDTVIEKALKKKGVPFRLYPYRYKDMMPGPFGHTKIDTETKEVVLLKMHGSINWFDKSDYLISKENWRYYGRETNPRHLVFDGRIDSKYIHRLVEEPYPEEKPLYNVYILEKLEEYFKQHEFIFEEPVIVSPSYNKLINLNYLKDFWQGFMESGGYDTKVVIIGSSLPSHDEYVIQPMYWFIRNFQNYQDEWIGKKSRLKIVDFKQTEKDIKEFKKRYRFVNQKKTDFYFDGFNEQTLDAIFSED